MKGKKKVILGSALAIALSASMIAGSTLALFTSESTVNIAVTSAKVSVSAELGNLEQYTVALGQDGVQTQVPVEAGKEFAEISADKTTVNLTNVAPGDKAVFQIKVTNNSTIAVKYRTKIECDSGYKLMSGLSFKVTPVDEEGNATAETEDYSRIAQYVSAWADLDDSTALEVEVELPFSQANQNEYMDLTTHITYSVEAIQANGAVAGADESEVTYVPEGEVYEVTTAAELTEAFTDVAANGGSVVVNAPLAVDGDVTLNKDALLVLNESLTLTESHFSADQGAKVVIEGKNRASITATQNKKTSFLCVTAGSEMDVNDVSVAVNTGAAFFVTGKEAKLNVENSTITVNGLGYAVSTNAENEGNHYPEININNSTLSTKFTAVLFNVPGTLNISQTQIRSGFNGVIVRGGTAKIVNSSIVNDVDFSEPLTGGNAAYGLNGDSWGTGNFVALVALVVGNKGGSSYNYPASCTLVNTTVSHSYQNSVAVSIFVPAVYVYGNSAETSATLVYDANSSFKVEGEGCSDEPIVVEGAGSASLAQ